MVQQFRSRIPPTTMSAKEELMVPAENLDLYCFILNLLCVVPITIGWKEKEDSRWTKKKQHNGNPRFEEARV